MTPRAPRALRLVIGVAALALVVAACGASGPSATGSPAAGSAAPAATAPTAAPASATPGAEASAGAGSAPTPTPLPPLTRVPDLEAMLPAKVGDLPVQPHSLTGADVMTTGDPTSIQALQTILDKTGGKPADYSFAWSAVGTGSGNDSAIGVFRVKGADPAVIRDVLIAQAQASANAANGVLVSPGQTTIGGKDVKTVSAALQDGTVWTSYYLPKGDVLFFVQTTDAKIAQEFLAGI